MNGTPRMSSAFPSTPQTQRRPPPQYGASQSMPRRSLNVSSMDPIKKTADAPEADNGPLIPLEWIDAPSQRFYAFALYLALWSWRMYDWNTLQDSEEQSLWLFMKWLFIDGTFLFGLPSLRIPWLEWEPATMLLFFVLHALVDGMLMFQIALPIGAGFAAVGRSFWGAYEMAVNEHNVNLQSIMHNDSLILGRQIIHILPEGSAVLNAEREAFCVDGMSPEARLPITINATNPVSIDILRIDLETQANETIKISKSQIKAMHKDASRMISYSEKPNEPKTLYHTVKKPGLYVLQKVVDETNLEVSLKRLAHTVVVPCPAAIVRQPTSNKCKGELSDVEMAVTGTPPLRVKYHKMVNKVLHESNFESIQPDDFVSPLTKQNHNAVVVPNRVDTEWARSRQIAVPLSEYLGQAGSWVYSIDEVQDGFGNRVTYSDHDQDEQERRPRRAASLHQTITVHERPHVKLTGCTPQMPLKVAKGKGKDLPVQYESTGRGAITDTPYRLQYVFTPTSQLSETGDHSRNPQKEIFTVKNVMQQPPIRDPGLYTLTGVSTEFCEGEVMQPASCLLQNPPEPSLSIRKEQIADKCAGSPIGLRVDLDLTGTAPFEVTYKMMKKGERHHSIGKEKVSGHRGQMELTPKTAGVYTYEFIEISDAVYKEQTLKSKDLQLEQEVLPSASAQFIGLQDKYVACIDDQINFEVALSGSGPFTLEYEILHSGRRHKHQLVAGNATRVSFSTPPLVEGGEYTVALASITDGAACTEFLKEEARISVRHQKPKVAFGAIDSRRSIKMLEGKKAELPLRLLAGEAPWTVQYIDAAGRTQQIQAQRPNDRLSVSESGTYELVSLHDNLCPGQVDESANKFDVSMIPHPEMHITPDESLEERGNIFQKADVCEGDEDAIEMTFKGLPPYHVQYKQSVTPISGTMAPKNKDLRAALAGASLRMDTAQAGTYEYKFERLGDANYDHSSRHFSPLVVKQKVHARPSAAFKNPGKTYSYCSVESDGEEVIPIVLQGTPPFSIEVEIKHLGSVKPETVMLHADKTSTEVKIPHRNLHLGKSSVALRRVSDARGCSRTLDSTTPRVQISVHDAPTITPLESSDDHCVGDRLNFGLSGTAPFSVFYTFEGHERKAISQTTTFRRLAEKPGTFTITGVQDSASGCRANTHLVKRIHGMPSARVSKGKDSYVDIHEGGEAEILFEFGGSPPFEFTYTRSSNADRKGGRGVVLDMRSEISDEHSMRVAAHEEGTYEVVAIKDRYCAYSRPGVKVGEKQQKKLGYY